MALVVGGLVGMAAVHASAWEVLLESLVLGVGFGFGVQTSSTLVTQGVARELTGISTALNSTVRRFGGGVGAQVGAAELSAVQLPAAGAPSQLAFLLAFATAAVFCLAGGAAALLLPHGDG